MILDLLANHGSYLTLHRRLAPAFAWLTAQDWNRVADGKTLIADEDLFGIVETGTTALAETRKFESHRRYLDIQYEISGGERMGWCPASALSAGIQGGPDIWFHPEPTLPQQVIVTPGYFAIFLPLEGHKPCCQLADAAAPFRKCVVKVAFD